MTPQHTSGPWSADEKRHGYDQVIRNADRDPVASVYIAGYGPRTANANASLIAAAPDLLALVRRIAAHFEYTDSPLGIEARAIIAKVEGR